MATATAVDPCDFVIFGGTVTWPYESSYRRCICATGTAS